LYDKVFKVFKIYVSLVNIRKLNANITQGDTTEGEQETTQQRKHNWSGFIYSKMQGY
jgi:hypothetical protein